MPHPPMPIRKRLLPAMGNAIGEGGAERNRKTGMTSCGVMGAIGVAAVLQGLTGHKGKKIGVIVSGGNLDVNLLARIIEQGMVRDGRR